MQEDSGILVSFLGALQASIAVLLTILAGVIAAQFNLLSEPASKEISKVCVKLFMPALLIVNIGSQLNLETGYRYLPILIWGLTYSFSSMLFGLAMTRIFKMPEWVTPAITFNNTTSLPLLLVQALDATGLLNSLDPSGGAVARAKSYFLINSMVGNSLTFALGPKLLKPCEEEFPEDHEDKKDEGEVDREIESQEEEAEHANEETSLLPNGVVRAETSAGYAAYKKGKHAWDRLPNWARIGLDFLYAFVNPPVIGAGIGVLIGLVPALHRLFFNSQQEGGYLNAWLTSALSNVGDLFAALQVVVTGVKLSQSVLRMKKGEDSGRVPWIPFTLVTVIRFFVWPAISISVIYLIATKTNLLSDDPILWFSMMLMPTGPTALLLTALADVTGSDEQEKFSIAKFLTVSLLHTHHSAIS